jgi:hypothetical protein
LSASKATRNQKMTSKTDIPRKVSSDKAAPSSAPKSVAAPAAKRPAPAETDACSGHDCHFGHNKHSDADHKKHDERP